MKVSLFIFTWLFPKPGAEKIHPDWR